MPDVRKSLSLIAAALAAAALAGLMAQTNGLFQKRAGCRRVARRYLADDGIRPPRILGFACDGGGDGVACRQGAR